MANPVVSVPQGQVKGRIRKNYSGEKFYSFCGIPYAKAPIGNLRFADPQPPDKWNGIFDATKRGAECPSAVVKLLGYIGREDNCLNLNVFTKQISPDADNLKPVMFFIHGGGFIAGSNRPIVYGPQYLMMEDIVLVCTNYRLGVFGFLSVEDESLGIPGNAGLKDQVMGLKWVQYNIKYFGGDPNNVTIFGQSAGGASVHYLTLSPLAKGLFHRAIIQSGCALNPWAHGTRGTKEICQRLKYPDTNEAKIVNYLRKICAKKLAKAAAKSRDTLLPGEKRFYGPVVETPSETAFISDTPENIIKSGNYNKVPMIIGYTDAEGILYEYFRKLNAHSYLTRDFVLEIDHQEKARFEDNTARDVAKKVEQYYYGENEETIQNIDKTMLLKSDTLFLHKLHKSIQLHGETSTEPIYVYRMSLETSLNVFKKLYLTNHQVGFLLVNQMQNNLNKGIIKNQLTKLIDKLSTENASGTAHADDLPYLFRPFFVPKIKRGTLEYQSMRRFVKLWTNFAKYGNPTPDDCVDEYIDIKWKPVDGEENYLHFGEQLKLIDNPDYDRMKFWDDIYENYAIRHCVSKL